jgi:archaellum component FlaC
LATDGTLSCTSDINLKKNIDGINYGLSALMQLKPVAFNWKTQDDSAAKTLGFIAQDVEQVIPQLVTTDAASGYKELNTIGLIPVLTKSIQEQQGEITDVQTSISSQFASANNQISQISLKTDASATTLAQLQTSIDDQLSKISNFQTSISGDFSTFKTQLTNDESKMTNYNQQFTALDSRIQALETASSQGTLTADLQTQIDTLKDQTKALTDFYTALTLGNVVTKDAKGNVDLLDGKLTAKEICVDDICITKDVLLDLLKRSGIDAAPQQEQSPKSDSKAAGDSAEPGGQNVQNAEPTVSSTQTDKKADAAQPTTSDNSQPTVTDATTSDTR